MKTILFFVLIVLLLSCNCNSIKYQVGGTLVICAIASDGIIIAIDSRASIKGDKNNWVAFADSLPKLFLLNNKYPIAVTGGFSIHGKTCQSIISDFNLIEDPNKNVQQSFIDFKKYLLDKYKTFSSQFYGGGYYLGMPYIYSFTEKLQSADNNGFLNNIGNDLTPYLKVYIQNNYSCDQLVPVFESAIKLYSKDFHLEQTIGGPISLLKVTAGNRVTWIKNDFRNRNIKTFKELVNLVSEKENKNNFIKWVSAIRYY